MTAKHNKLLYGANPIYFNRQILRLVDGMDDIIII